MYDEMQTYMSENDILREVRRLEARGLAFVPMTCDEIILAERLCRRGKLMRDGATLRLPFA